MDKKLAEKRHFKRRAKERFGVFLNRFDIKDIVTNILENKYELIYNPTWKEEHWKAKIKNREMIIIFDRTRKMVVTCYYKNWIDRVVEDRERFLTEKYGEQGLRGLEK